jgi:hypothetical protein
VTSPCTSALPPHAFTPRVSALAGQPLRRPSPTPQPPGRPPHLTLASPASLAPFPLPHIAPPPARCLQECRPSSSPSPPIIVPPAPLAAGRRHALTRSTSAARGLCRPPHLLRPPSSPGPTRRWPSSRSRALHRPRPRSPSSSPSPHPANQGANHRHFHRAACHRVPCWRPQISSITAPRVAFVLKDQRACTRSGSNCLSHRLNGSGSGDVHVR